MMTRTLILAAGLAGGLACDLGDFSDGGQRYTDDFQRSFDLRQGARVEIEGFNGPVEIIGWDRDKAELNGSKFASRKEALDRIKVDITNTPDSLLIRSLRPPREGWMRNANMGVSLRLHVPRKVVLERIVTSNGAVRVENVDGRCRIRTSNGSVRVMDSAGEVNLETSNGRVEVERFSGMVDLRTSNGAIRAKAVKGQMVAATSNGPIEVEGGGLDVSRPVRLETSNGAIRLRLSDSGALPEVRAHTSNGPITVSLPGSAGARLRAATSNAPITTDFPLNQTTKTGKHRLEGVIGSGGALLDLTSSNGAISLVRN